MYDPAGGFRNRHQPAILHAMAKKTPKAKSAGLTYADAGVDLETYDRFTGSLGAHLRRTHGPRVIDLPGGFAGMFRLDYNEKLFRKNYRDPVLVACTDGVGTKLKIAAEMGVYDTIGIDLVAMSVNDLIVQAAEPLFFLDYIAVPRVEPAMLDSLVRGIAEGCRQAGCALLGGETAEMPGVYPPGAFDLAGFAVGVVELKRATDTTRVKPGDVILGLASDGVHSNGYSLARKVVARLKLDRVYPDLDGQRTLGEVLLTPTRIYTRPIVSLLRSYKVKKVVSGMAHVTGGGLAGNLSRALPGNVDARVDLDAWPVPGVFRFLQERGRIDAGEMGRVFNMGIGYVLIVRPTFADSITARLTREGETVYRLGTIAKGKGCVRVITKRK